MIDWFQEVERFYAGKRVFITGHTGFKGSWLSLWLTMLGAEVTGYSKDIPTTPSAFELLGLTRHIRHLVGDVRDKESLGRAILTVHPDCVFHLAAQPLVRLSYSEPVETFSTNVLGTVNVLEAVRNASHPITFVNVTSDKCYENRGWEFGYRETDALGGSDPYSASKGCAELVFASYFRSYLATSSIRAASARAGNVIGGGDFALDRIVPDCMRAWQRGETVVVRNPFATRPWQHVLEPLGGYLLLGATLGREDASAVNGEALNFGPLPESLGSVRRVVEGLGQHFEVAPVEILSPERRALEPHEAHTLKLSIDKAGARLGWQPTLSFDQTVQWTAEWYKSVALDPASTLALTSRQINDFSRQVRKGA